ncbi:MAG: hypothetical protein WBH45_01365 [Acidobacteriaceae bacterium]
MPNEPLQERRKTPRRPSSTGKAPSASVPSPELLLEYSRVAPELPGLVVQEWGHRHRRAFIYATTALVAGALLAGALVGGFVYLVMKDHGGYADGLLGAGVLSLVTGFLSTRLDREGK